jgi:hypothetical protein
LLRDRTATGTAEWLAQHPEVEIVSRDRCGLYAQGARADASQARQVADRFHLLQNLRETMEAQLSRVDRPTGRALLSESSDEPVTSTTSGPGSRSDVAEHRVLTRQAHRCSRQAIFDQIHSLREAGNSIAIVARETGFGSRTIRKGAVRLTGDRWKRAVWSVGLDGKAGGKLPLGHSVQTMQVEG